MQRDWEIEKLDDPVIEHSVGFNGRPPPDMAAVIVASKPLETRNASKRAEPMRSNPAGGGHDRRERLDLTSG